MSASIPSILRPILRHRSRLFSLAVGLVLSISLPLTAQTPRPAVAPAGEPVLITVREFLAGAPVWGEQVQVRLRGTVTHTISDRTYFIQEGDAGVYVFQKPDPPFRVGDLVELTGYPSLGGIAPTLQNCVARVIGRGLLPTPEEITPSQLTEIRHAMKLVRLRGRLIEDQLMGGRLMVLRTPDDGRSFHANLEGVDNPEMFAHPPLGSLLEITGVLVLRAGPDGGPAGATILLRSTADVALIEGPPFWTLRRVGEILGGTGLALVLALVWVVTLRRQVGRQTRLVEERFEREAALRELEDRFAKVFRASPDAVMIARADDGRVLDGNPACERLSGIPRSEFIGRREDELNWWVDSEARLRALDELAANGSLSNFECLVRDRSGREVACLFSAEWIELNGARCRLGVFRDVTSQKQAEAERRIIQSQLQQSQRMESLGTLAGGIAHDFNNILAAILGNAELAKDDPALPGPARDFLREICTASLRGRDLVQQILTFSRKQPHARQALTLGPVVAEAARLLRATLPASIEVETKLDPECPPVLADAIQIHQIVMNLGTNAWHAMEPNPGRMIISLRAVQVDDALAARTADLRTGLHACLAVTDEGVGMSAVLQERIFEPFFTTKELGKGTGLGLAAVHGIVKDHEGATIVESEPGHGTTIAIYLPAVATVAADFSATVIAESSRPGEGREVILIDDEESVLSVGRGFLERLGFRVTLFAEPAAALALLQREPERFDLMVTDLNMPGLNGLEVIARLRGVRPDMPVVLASGYCTDELRTRALSLGTQAILQKPLTLEELAAAIRGLHLRHSAAATVLKSGTAA